MMSTQSKATEKFLAFDGDCPMCRATVALLIRLKLVKPEQARGNHELGPADFQTAHAAGIRNQLVVIDPATRETRVGTDGLLWIVNDNTSHHFVVRLLGLWGPRQLLRWGYQVVSYNRRVISPPRSRIVCDCEPEVTLVRRLSLIVPLLVAVVLLTALFGAAVFHGWQLGDWRSGALFMEIAAGSGWIALVLASLFLMPTDKRIDYIAHLVVTMFVGTLVLVPASLLGFVLGREVLIALDCLSVLTSFILMAAMQRRRIAALVISRGWLWGWVIALAIGFTATTCFWYWRGPP